MGFLLIPTLTDLKTGLPITSMQDLSHEEIARRYPGVMKTTAGFNARSVRDSLLARGEPVEAGFIRFAYRPFDNRWFYWEGDSEAT